MSGQTNMGSAIRTRRTSITVESRTETPNYGTQQNGHNPENNVENQQQITEQINPSNIALNVDTQKIIGPTNSTLQQVAQSNSLQRLPQSKMDTEEAPDLGRGTSADDKKGVKKPKRRKVLTTQAEQFFPQFLNFLSDYHYQHTIREGWRYQAVIPEQHDHRHKTHKLVNVWKSDNEFDNDVLKDFKLKFGDNRTQQQLCMIKRQLQCDWKQIPRYLQANKQVYKKAFKEKDKTLIKAAKITF